MTQRCNRSLRLAALSSAALIGLSVISASPAVAGGRHDGGGSTEPRVVASGLDNPRQLSFTGSGSLLVAEAGAGGTQSCKPGPEGGTVCFGASGAVTEVSSRGRQRRIITGLPSYGAQGSGLESIGPSDVHGDGRSVTVLIGFGDNPANRDGLAAPGRRFGTLIQTTRHGYRTIADIAAWEAEHNPIDNPDSDPSGLLYEHGKYVVADAGGNTVLEVGRHGRIGLLAALPDRMVTGPAGAPIPMQAVPTSVATRGSDGALYVSELTGFPFPVGAANIYRLDPRTGTTTVYATGLTNVTDLAFRGRTLYAVQIATNGLLAGPVGSLVKVTPGGTVPADHTVVAGDLPAPYGIAIKGGYAYVTTHSVEVGTGEVIRIRL